MLADVGLYGEPGFIRLQCRVTLIEAFPAGSLSQTKPGPGVFIISLLAGGTFLPERLPGCLTENHVRN